MITRPSPDQTTGDVGRLPTPLIDSPIDIRSFPAMAEAWRTSGVWLSLWNQQAECLTTDSMGPQFWTLLWNCGEPFRLSMAQFVREAMDEPSREGATDCVIGGPWAPDLTLVAAPIRAHRRAVGMVVGAMLTKPELGEPLVRLFGRCEIDLASMQRLSSEIRRTDPSECRILSPLLNLTVVQARQMEMRREEVAALTHNLEGTYEELHLIYQISGKMSLSRRPADTLPLMGRDLLATCRAQAIAFVLKEPETQGNLSATRGQLSPPQLSDRVIQVGPGAPTLADLDRLAESLQIRAETRLEHLLLNQACRRPELAWAAPWLRHLVVLPLWNERELLGVMLAINCNDGGDFTSVDVQLFRAIADRVAPFLENRRLYDDLSDLLMGMLHALVNSIDAKDTYTCGHSERVAHISRALAHAANLSPTICERIYLAGLLHDVGKIGVPDAILCKTGKLTTEEFDVMRKHPGIGVRILERVRQIQDLLPGVLYHHERMDGRGYPSGLAAPAIPLFGRIICIADCFDAMTTNRTYRSALPLPVAVAEVRRCAGTQFDPALAEIFLKLDHAKLLAETKAMSSGEDVLDCVRHIRPAG